MSLISPKVQKGQRSSVPENPIEYELQAAAEVAATKTLLTNHIDLGLFDGCIFQIDFTKASLTGVNLYIEFADTDDAADYKQMTIRDSQGDGSVKVLPAIFKVEPSVATVKLHFPVKKQGRFMRVYQEPNGAHAGSSMEIKVTGAADVEEIPSVGGGSGAAANVNVTATVGLTDTELRATPVPVSGTVAVTGTQTDALTDTELRATPVPVSGTVAVTGTQTDALTDTELRATPVPVSGTVAVTGVQTDALTDTELRATPVPVSGTVAVTGTQTDALTDTELRATPVPISGTVSTGGLTDSELRATAVPVSGPLTDTELRATAVPVAISTGSDSSTIVSAETVGDGSKTTEAATAIATYYDNALQIISTVDGTYQLYLGEATGELAAWADIVLNNADNERGLCVPIPGWANFVEVKNRSGASANITVKSMRRN